MEDFTHSAQKYGDQPIFCTKILVSDLARFKLKNPSKDYQAILQDKEEKDARQEIIGALKRCLISSGANPDDFHILVDEVKEIWEV